MTGDHRGGAAALVVATYFLLTFLVWGLTATHRGLWQDDATLLGISFDRDPTTLELFSPIMSPTRRLLSLPFVAAAHTGAPILVLQLMYGAIWLGTGLLARDLTRQLAGDEMAAYVAGALTLCATSDFLTNSPVELGYDISAILILAAFCAAVRWIQGQSATWLVVSVALGQASLWTIDGSLPSVFALSAVVLGERASGHAQARRARDRHLGCGCNSVQRGVGAIPDRSLGLCLDRGRQADPFETDHPDCRACSRSTFPHGDGRTRDQSGSTSPNPGSPQPGSSRARRWA